MERGRASCGITRHSPARRGAVAHPSQRHDMARHCEGHGTVRHSTARCGAAAPGHCDGGQFSHSVA
eukprot:8409175-Alexandrium_andersonii.AAC.1